MENSAKLYHKVWDILVEHAGAKERDRDTFVGASLETNYFRRLIEYRFCGTLGFGGKLWRSDGRLYVSCYRADETPERLDTMERVNKLLTDITPVGGIHGPP